MTNQKLSLLDRLQTLPAFEDLSESSRQWLLQAVTLHRLQPEVPFFPTDSDYLLTLDGIVLLCKFQTDAQTPYTVRLPLGGMYPLDEDNIPGVDTTIEAVNDGLIALLSSADLDKLFSYSPSLRHALLRSMRFCMTKMTEEFLHRTSAPLAARLARLFIEIYETEDDVKFVSLKHRQLAKMLSTRRETITTMLKQFQEEGLITGQWGQITLVDMLALEKLASEA